jgi:hypothetical protein
VEQCELQHVPERARGPLEGLVKLRHSSLAKDPGVLQQLGRDRIVVRDDVRLAMTATATQLFIPGDRLMVVGVLSFRGSDSPQSLLSRHPPPSEVFGDLT